MGRIDVPAATGAWRAVEAAWAAWRFGARSMACLAG
jgi:hypothetical protein